MTKAEIGPRIGALVIDGLIALPLVLVGWIPFVGLISGPLLTAYWLCRDLVRPSLGKKALGLDVAGLNGERPTDQELLMRNIPFALPHLISMIPIVGGLLSLGILMLIFVGELVMFITQGQRFGDQLAKTQVVVKATTPAD